jgi:hypothetical protein
LLGIVKQTETHPTGVEAPIEEEEEEICLGK